MGLKDLLSRWSKGEDERAIEREEQEELAHARPIDRARDAEDFEAKKDDLAAGRGSFAGSEAEATVADDLE
jgi:hypothetical protein